MTKLEIATGVPLVYRLNADTTVAVERDPGGLTMPKIVELPAEQAARHLGALADVLLDAVRGGASVGYMADISRLDAEAFWRDTIDAVASRKTLLFAAFDGETLIGTVLLSPCFKPNQPHRADVSKLLVLQSARRGGVASALMQALETRALALGRTAAHARHGDRQRRGGFLPPPRLRAGRHHPRLHADARRQHERHQRLLQAAELIQSSACGRRRSP